MTGNIRTCRMSQGEFDARENCKFSNEKLHEEYCRKTTQFSGCYSEILDKKLRVLRKKSLQR